MRVEYFFTAFRSRVHQVPLLVFLAIAGYSQAQTVDVANPKASEAFLPDEPNLEDYLAAAAEHRPILAADRGRAEALRSNAGGVGALPGLKLGWGEMIVPVETRVGPQQRVLSISQRIVQEHGGEISVKSEVGKGSIFTVYLPIGQSEEQ